MIHRGEGEPQIKGPKDMSTLTVAQPRSSLLFSPLDSHLASPRSLPIQPFPSLYSQLKKYRSKSQSQYVHEVYIVQSNFQSSLYLKRIPPAERRLGSVVDWLAFEGIG